MLKKRILSLVMAFLFMLTVVLSLSGMDAEAADKLFAYSYTSGVDALLYKTTDGIKFKIADDESYYSGISGSNQFYIMNLEASKSGMKYVSEINGRFFYYKNTNQHFSYAASESEYASDLKSALKKADKFQSDYFDLAVADFVNSSYGSFSEFKKAFSNSKLYIYDGNKLYKKIAYTKLGSYMSFPVDTPFDMSQTSLKISTKVVSDRTDVGRIQVSWGKAFPSDNEVENIIVFLGSDSITNYDTVDSDKKDNTATVSVDPNKKGTYELTIKDTYGNIYTKKVKLTASKAADDPTPDEENETASASKEKVEKLSVKVSDIPTKIEKTPFTVTLTTSRSAIVSIPNADANLSSSEGDTVYNYEISKNGTYDYIVTANDDTKETIKGSFEIKGIDENSTGAQWNWGGKNISTGVDDEEIDIQDEDEDGNEIITQTGIEFGSYFALAVVLAVSGVFLILIGRGKLNLSKILKRFMSLLLILSLTATSIQFYSSNEISTVRAEKTGEGGSVNSGGSYTGSNSMWSINDLGWRIKIYKLPFKEPYKYAEELSKNHPEYIVQTPSGYKKTGTEDGEDCAYNYLVGGKEEDVAGDKSDYALDNCGQDGEVYVWFKNKLGNSRDDLLSNGLSSVGFEFSAANGVTLDTPYGRGGFSGTNKTINFGAEGLMGNFKSTTEDGVKSYANFFPELYDSSASTADEAQKKGKLFYKGEKGKILPSESFVVTAEAVMLFSFGSSHAGVYSWGDMNYDFTSIKSAIGGSSAKGANDHTIDDAYKTVSFSSSEISPPGSTGEYYFAGKHGKKEYPENSGKTYRIRVYTARSADPQSRGWIHLGGGTRESGETTTTSDDTIKGVVLNTLTYDANKKDMKATSGIVYPYYSIKGEEKSSSETLPKSLKSLKNKAVYPTSTTKMDEITSSDISLKAIGSVTDSDTNTIVSADINKYTLPSEGKISRFLKGVDAVKNGKYDIGLTKTAVPLASGAVLALGDYYKVGELKEKNSGYTKIKEPSDVLAQTFAKGTNGNNSEINNIKSRTDKAQSYDKVVTAGYKLIAESYNDNADKNSYSFASGAEVDKSKPVTYKDNGNSTKINTKSNSGWAVVDIVQMTPDNVQTQYVTVDVTIESDGTAVPEAGDSDEVRYPSTDPGEVDSPGDVQYIIYEPKNKEDDLESSTPYKDSTKEQPSKEKYIEEITKDGAKPFGGGKIEVGVGKEDGNKKYGYNIIFITIHGTGKIHAKLELFDYELNHVFSSLVHNIDSDQVTNSDVVLNRNPGISRIGDTHGLDWDVSPCDTAHSGINHTHEAHTLDKITVWDKSSGNYTIKKDNTMLGSSPVMLPKIGDYWAKRSKLVEGKSFSITESGALEDQSTKTMIDVAWNLSRGISEDIRNLSGIAYSSNDDSSRKYGGGSNDKPSFAVSKLVEMKGIKTKKPDTIYESGISSNSAKQKVLDVDEKYKHVAGWKSRSSSDGNKVVTTKYDITKLVYKHHQEDWNDEEQEYEHDHYGYKHNFKTNGKMYPFTYNGTNMAKLTVTVEQIIYKYIANKSKKEGGSVPTGTSAEDQYFEDHVLMPDRSDHSGNTVTHDVYDNTKQYGIVYHENYDDYGGGDSIVLNYRPDVTMSEQIYNTDAIGSSDDVQIDSTVEILGDRMRYTNSGSLYFMKMLGGSGNSYDVKGKLFSDTFSMNANDKNQSSSNKIVPSGSDVTINVDTDGLGLEFYGYAMDITSDDSDHSKYVKNGDNVNEEWNNPDYESTSKADFTEYVKEWDKVGNFGADLLLDLDSQEYYNNFSASIGKLEALKDGDIVDDGVYHLVFDHGELLKNNDSDSMYGGKGYKAMIKQMAQDYNCSESQAEQIFEASELHKAILDSIVSDSSSGNKSMKANSGGHKETDTESDLTNTSHWYDETIRTVVIRRFKTKNRLQFKNIVLSDKVDYNLKTKNGVGKWYLTMYLNGAKFNTVRNNDEFEYYDPQHPDTKSAALRSGTVLMNNVYVQDCDFKVSDQSTDVLGN